jgi:hypothetical protein
MTTEADSRPAERKLTFLDFIVIAFLGLTGVGLIGIGGFGWLIVNGLAHTHGSDAGVGVSIIFPAIAVGGIALMVSAIKRAARKD